MGQLIGPAFYSSKLNLPLAGEQSEHNSRSVSPPRPPHSNAWKQN